MGTSRTSFEALSEKGRKEEEKVREREKIEV
jgi:hypothetical protein